VKAFTSKNRLKMKKLVVLLLLLFVAGCNAEAQLEKQWLSRSKGMLIAMRGTPNRVMSDGFGGEIYTYVKIHYSTYPSAFGYHYGEPFYGHGRGYGYHTQWVATGSSKTMFWIDPYNKIYRVRVANAD
jgi:CubicO group peptidase (beta-lactamase class C family)